MSPCPLSAATLVITLITGLLPAPLTAAIYRCPGTDGAPHYTQFPCGNGAQVVLEALQIVEVPPLSAAEQAVLDELARQRSERRAARDKARRKAARQESRERAARAARCESARSALDALARQRRKGYSLQQAPELDRREGELEAAVRDNC